MGGLIIIMVLAFGAVVAAFVPSDIMAPGRQGSKAKTPKGGP